MEILKALLTRMRRTGVLLITGVILIMYIGLGFVYWQQDAQQKKFTEQSTKLSAVLAKPLSPITELQAELEAAKQALAPMTDIKAIDTLVGIAKKNGINTDNNSGKFIVPPVTLGSRTVDGGNYQVLSFKGISVSGNYSNVMAFINELDSGETPETKTMVVTVVNLSKVGEGKWTETETQATMDIDIYTKP